MTIRFGEWTIGLNGEGAPGRELIGGKAWSVARMQALGLTVPPAFVVTTRAWAAYLADNCAPAGLEDEIGAATGWLEGQTGRRFGARARPLLVSVRSGAPVSMPGMMDTVLNLGINEITEAALAEECGDADFARNTHRRFLDLYAHIVLKAAAVHLADRADPKAWAAIAAAAGEEVPEDPREQLRRAVRAVFESWNSRRARRYRQHHDIPDDLGTAVTVQAMVFGKPDARWARASRSPAIRSPATLSHTANICRARKARMSSPASSRRNLSRRLPTTFRRRRQNLSRRPGRWKRPPVTCRTSNSPSSEAGSISCKRARPSSPRTPPRISRSTLRAKGSSTRPRRSGASVPIRCACF